MEQTDSEKRESEIARFLATGTSFFATFAGKNTPNILLNIVSTLEKVEHAIASVNRPHVPKAYLYLQAETTEELWANVQKFLKEGWEPHGTIVVARQSFYQAMAKFEPNNAPTLPQ